MPKFKLDDTLEEQQTEPEAATVVTTAPLATPVAGRKYFANRDEAVAYFLPGRHVMELAGVLAAHKDENGYWIP